MKKRVISLLLAAAMVFGLCGPLGGLVPAAQAAETAAADGGTYEGIEWSYADGVLTLSGGALPAAGEFPWLAYGEEIWQVVLGEDITQVSTAAFEDLVLSRLIFQSDEMPELIDAEVGWERVDCFYYPDTWENMQNSRWVPYARDKAGECGPVDEDTGEYGANLTWKLEGDTLTISGEGAMADWNNGKCTPWAFYSDEIRHVVIEDGVTTIGASAFTTGDFTPRSLLSSGPEFDYPIESVTLGGTVERIGNFAFAYCDSLKELSVPASVKRIGDEAFLDCFGLASLTFAEGTALGYLNASFSGCIGLTHVELPATDTTLGNEDPGASTYDNSFESCTSLQEVTFRDGAAYIGSEMFAGCTALEKVTIPHSMQAVSDDAFDGCVSLTDIYYDGYADEWKDILTETGVGEWPGSAVVHFEEDAAPPKISNVTKGGVHNSDFTVSATVSDNRPKITVRFDLSTDGGGQWTLVGKKTVSGESGTVETTVDVDGLAEGTIAVRITATDYVGNENTYTVEHIIDRTAPAAPVLHDPQAMQPTVVSVTWDAPADEDLRSFKLYRRADGETEWRNLFYGNQLGYTDVSVKPGTAYTYYVTAVDTAYNESEPSTVKTITTPEDSTAPTVAAVTPGSGNTFGPKQTIKVHAGDDSGLASVVVEYRAQGAEDWAEWKTIAVSGKSASASFTLSGLAGGVYELRAYAVDAAGLQSAYSDTVTYTLDADAPGISGLTAEAASEQVTLCWASEAEGDLAGFYLYRISSGGASARIGSVSAITGQTEYTFTDRLHWSLCGQTYTYRVTATDRYGNERSVTSGEVTPQAEQDTQPPEAVLTAPSTGFAADPISFSAAGSSDNREIRSYHWDFGDGETAEGKTVTHHYTAGGSFTVTLTVTDADGNETKETQTINVTAEEDNAQVNVTVLGYASGSPDEAAPLSRAQVVYDMGGANTSYYTDGSGKVSFRTVETGEVQLGAYAGEYLPGAASVTLEHGESVDVVIRLEKAPVVTGELESKELTYDEIVDLGIDTSDPANQNVYEFAASIHIGGNIEEYTYYVNDGAQLVGGDVLVDQITVGDSVYTIKPHAARVEYPSEGGEIRAPETITYVTVLRIPGTVSMLRQFFEAELTVINQAGAAFAFENCTAELDVPDGLSVIPTDTTAESASAVLTGEGQESGVIGGQQSAAARWILRGDRAGTYQLSAAFDGSLRDFDVPLHAEFASEDSIRVRDASEVQLDMIVSNVMLDRTVYTDLELSCDTGTVNLPEITLGDYKPQEIVLRDDGTGSEIPAGVGSGVTELPPGSTLVYRYAIELPEDMPLLFACNLLEGELAAEGVTTNTYTRNITRFKLFRDANGDFAMTDMGVFIRTLPTLGEADAKDFWRFIFNKSSDPEPDDRYYCILRGDLSDYDGTLEELKMEILSMLEVVRARMNCYVKESNERLGFLTDVMADSLWGKLEGEGVTGAEAYRDYAGTKIFEGIRDCFTSIEGIDNQYLQALQDVTIAAESYSDVVSTMQGFIENMQLAVTSIGIVLESEYTARYAYFNYYLNQRINYEQPGDAGFRLLLDLTKGQLVDKYWASEALDTITWITGKDSWTNHTDTIERWAETLYQLEVVALGYQSGGEPENQEVVLRYRSDSSADGSAVNRTERYALDWDWFANPGTAYNQKLASLTLGMTMAGFTDPETDALKDAQLPPDDIRRAANIQLAYDALGFTDVRYFNYDKPLSDTSDKVAFSIASRPLEDGSTLVAAFVRGGGYGGEWVSNFLVGAADDHQGFRTAAEQVERELKAYLAGLDADSVKLWMGGYSRAAAVVNLTAHDLLAEEVVAPGNLYAYTFATPNGHYGTDNEVQDSGIYNIVSPHDIVPSVAPEQWGFARYGTTLYLPMDNSPIEGYFEAQTDSGLTVTAKTRYVTEMAEELVTTMVAGRGQYVTYIQQDLMDAVRGWSVSGSVPADAVLRVVQGIYEGIRAEGIDVFGQISAERLLDKLRQIDMEDVHVLDAHNAEYYQAWMQAGSLGDIRSYENQYIQTSILVECPVDVEVYDAQGALVAEIEDNKIVQADVPAAVVGDAKLVYLYDGDYSVNLTGTGEGSMEYTLRQYDGYQTVRTQNYYALPLAGGCVYTQAIDSETGGGALTDAAGQSHPADRETDGTGTTVRRHLIDVAGGTATHAAAAPGERVTVTADAPAQGTVFDHWEAVSDADGFVLENTSSATTAFTMPDGAARLTAVYREESTGGGSGGSTGGGGGGGSLADSAPDASVSGTGGKVSASDDGTVTITPDEGYQIGSITVNGEEVAIPADGKLTGLGEEDRVVVTFEKAPDETGEGLFADVASGAWYADAVQYVCENGIMNGISETAFGPDRTTTRAMAVTMLYRLEGEPDAAASGFADVPADAYYADAVAWAQANDIVNGVSETAFAPDDPVTREQMAAVLYRYAQFKGYDVTASNDLSSYTDASRISSYAITAMGWANAAGLITGNTGTTLNPRGNATRAEVATILMRFCEDIVR